MRKGGGCRGNYFKEVSGSETGLNQSLKNHLVPGQYLISFFVFDKDVRVPVKL